MALILRVARPQTKRNREFVIVRGIAVILMVAQHLWLLIFAGRFNTPVLNYFVLILGNFLVAPVFLFLLGANIVSSRRNSPRQLFFRGLKLIILGYVLSALRFFLPIILLQHFGLINNPENILYKWPPIFYLLEIDIFQIAGLSLAGIAFLKWRKVKTDYYLAVALLVVLLTPILHRFNLAGFFGEYFIGVFTGVGSCILFPFFPCFFYSVVGFYFGNYLAEAKDKGLFYRSIPLKMIPVIILGTIFSLINLDFSNSSYIHNSFGWSLLSVAIIIYSLFSASLITHLPKTKIPDFLAYLSRNVTAIYFCQWLLIAWLAIATIIK